MGNRIIIIDDDQELRKLLAMCLSLEGIESLQASHGQEALELLETLAPQDRPKLFIVDHSMPVMDGLEFIGELFKRPLVASPEILLYTGSISLPEVSIAGRKIQVFAKPVDMELILKFIRRSFHSFSEPENPGLSAY